MYTTEVAVDSRGRLVVMCWSGSDKYCAIEEVRVEVVYKTRMSVVKVQKGPDIQFTTMLTYIWDAPYRSIDALQASAMKFARGIIDIAARLRTVLVSTSK